MRFFQRFLVVIFLVLVFPINVSAFFVYDGESAKECQKLSDSEERGYCYYGYATENNDADFCLKKEIWENQRPYRITDCIDEIAVKEINPNLCEMINSENIDDADVDLEKWRDECRLKYAREAMDKNVCYEIVGPFYKTGCLRFFNDNQAESIKQDNLGELVILVGISVLALIAIFIFTSMLRIKFRRTLNVVLIILPFFIAWSRLYFNLPVFREISSWHSLHSFILLFYVLMGLAAFYLNFREAFLAWNENKPEARKLLLFAYLFEILLILVTVFLMFIHPGYLEITFRGFMSNGIFIGLTVMFFVGIISLIYFLKYLKVRHDKQKPFLIFPLIVSIVFILAGAFPALMTIFVWFGGTFSIQ